jgi:hypothetical protein
LVTNATIANTVTNQFAGRKKPLAAQFSVKFCAKIRILIKKQPKIVFICPKIAQKLAKP